jgi:hypothetical protein
MSFPKKSGTEKKEFWFDWSKRRFDRLGADSVHLNTIPCGRNSSSNTRLAGRTRSFETEPATRLAGAAEASCSSIGSTEAKDVRA